MNLRQILDAEAEYEASLTHDCDTLEECLNNRPEAEVLQHICYAIGDLPKSADPDSLIFNMIEDFDNFDARGKAFNDNAGRFMWAVMERLKEYMEEGE